MTITLLNFSTTFDAKCGVEDLWDMLSQPSLMSDWLDSMDGIEKGHFDADMREGGHMKLSFRIGGGCEIVANSRYLRMAKPVQSIAVDTTYDARPATSSLVRLAILPRGDKGSRLVHTETAHFLHEDIRPEQHRDFTDWWYASALREVAAA